jgi:hypothetical protein
MTPLVIDLDVREWAKQWGLDPALLQALVVSEGDIVKAVQKSVPSVHVRGEALMVACRSLTHRLWEYAKGMAQPGEDFPAYFCRYWAPVGVENDPTNLNRNLPINLRRLWLGPPSTVEA